jgi:hypothetical protein
MSFVSYLNKQAQPIYKATGMFPRDKKFEKLRFQNQYVHGAQSFL